MNCEHPWKTICVTKTPEAIMVPAIERNPPTPAPGTMIATCGRCLTTWTGNDAIVLIWMKLNERIDQLVEAFVGGDVATLRDIVNLNKAYGKTVTVSDGDIIERSSIPTPSAMNLVRGAAEIIHRIGERKS